jgi:hypothetical protein
MSRMVGNGQGQPPDNTGQRVTTTLSRRAARALQDASYLASTRGHGFRAHWTFTLGSESRTALLGGKFTLGSEIRRTVNALHAWNDDHGKPRLVNEWVSENPGDSNPHVHMNTDYLSRRQDFREYAAYVEDVWGHGYVEQERIRDPRAAAAYLLKCVGYVCKGEQSGQGTIYGNRYGMSQSLRNPITERIEVQDESGEVVRHLHRLTDEAESTGFVDLGRGLFATPHGIGSRPGSHLEPGAVARFLSQGGRW